MNPNGWKIKAITLRETVLMGGHPLANELPADEARTFDLMRIVRRALRDGNEELAASHYEELRQLTSSGEQMPIVYEPMTAQGWDVKAGFYLRDGKPYWLVGAAFHKPAMTPRDRYIIAGIIDVLGGHIDHDALSTHPIEHLVEQRIPFMWTWINQAPLMEIQIRGTGPTAKTRIVPKGTPPSDGYEPLQWSRGKE